MGERIFVASVFAVLGRQRDTTGPVVIPVISTLFTEPVCVHAFIPPQCRLNRDLGGTPTFQSPRSLS